MAFTKLTADLNIIAALGDRPNADNGLSAAQLKAKFDQSGNTIKTFINDTLIEEIKNEVGAPFVASTVAAMTDTSRVYVYTGSETGYTAGNWYYYNGSAWVSGGVYNAQALVTDKTLSVEDAAADGKAVGEALDEKANVDGYYDEMAVGSAEQLLSSVKVPDKVPYNFRTSGGSVDIGTRENQKAVVGGTLAFNQLVYKRADTHEATNKGITQKWTDGVLSLSGQLDTPPYAQVAQFENETLSVIAGHKYFASFINNAPNDAVYVVFYGGLQYTEAKCQRQGVVLNANSSAYTKIYIRVYPTDASISCKIYNPTLIDLTQMFGSTIADYIYTLETANEGDGVAWFKRLFPADYYAYNAGELMSVKTSAHKMIGFNAYDHTAGTAKVVGGNVYQITGTYTALSLNGESITPDASGYFTPSASGTLTVTGGNDTDTCVHIKWDGERDGDWEEYKEWNYALDADLELRGIPKLDADNKLYYDGDTYASDGTVTRKYGIVDLGTLTTWGYSAVYEYFGATIADKAATENFVVVKYTNIGKKTALQMSTAADKVISYENKVIRVKDSAYTDLESFETAMSGVYLVYELATPTTESADPYTELQNVDDWGTEEFIDTRTVPIPVGHDTDYQANLRAKLEMAPNSPDGDGDYIVRQTDGINTYVPLITPTEIPAAPTTDGTYILKCTVADGVAEYEWEARA